MVAVAAGLQPLLGSEEREKYMEGLWEDGERNTGKG